MALDPDLEAWLRLSFAAGLSNDAFRQLLIAFGGPQEILAATRAELAPLVHERAARAVLMPAPRELLERVAEWLAEPGNHVVTLGDPELFWRVCDANRAMRPDELTETIGRRLRITLPEGIPATPGA